MYGRLFAAHIFILGFACVANNVSSLWPGWSIDYRGSFEKLECAEDGFAKIQSARCSSNFKWVTMKFY